MQHIFTHHLHSSTLYIGFVKSHIHILEFAIVLGQYSYFYRLGETGCYNIGMFDKIFPSLKTRALIEQTRFGMIRSDKNSERYVIPMHTKNVWTK